jgi:Transglutaminase-like superfamily
MTATKLLLTLTLLLTVQLCLAQPPNDKSTRKELKKEAVINTEEDLKKFEEEWRMDSIKLMKEWKEQWLVDSLKLVKQANETIKQIEKIYQEKWNPADSLKYIGDKAKNFFSTANAKTLDEVVAVINKNFTKPLHKTRAVFWWIATNIRYDWDAYTSGLIKTTWDYKKDALQTFEERKGVCDHYSSLFKYMAEQCGLESIKISGHSKIWPDARVNTSRTDHAWNAVKINGNWKLMDVTWASDEDSTMEYFWFDTPPEKFIYSHLPEDTAYQLLKKKITLNEYALMPIVNKYLFLSKAPVNIPALGYFANTSGVFQLDMKSNSKKYRVEILITKMTANNERRFTGNETWQKIPVSAARDAVKDAAVYQTVVPGKGSWWIKVNLFEKLNYDFLQEIEFPSCMIFQVTYL